MRRTGDGGKHLFARGGVFGEGTGVAEPALGGEGEVEEEGGEDAAGDEEGFEEGGADVCGRGVSAIEAFGKGGLGG